MEIKRPVRARVSRAPAYGRAEAWAMTQLNLGSRVGPLAGLLAQDRTSEQRALVAVLVAAALSNGHTAVAALTEALPVRDTRPTAMADVVASPFSPNAPNAQPASAFTAVGLPKAA